MKPVNESDRALSEQNLRADDLADAPQAETSLQSEETQLSHFALLISLAMVRGRFVSSVRVWPLTAIWPIYAR